MTPLPQRKKTAEEIAKLRDQLGVPPSVESAGLPEAPPAASPAASPAVNPTAQSEVPPDSASPRTSPVKESAPSSTKSLWLPAPTYPYQQHKNYKLPAKRHSDEEIEEMRRREMLGKMNEPPPTNIKFMAAHPALIGLGYLLAIVGACSFWLKTYPWLAVAGGCIGALLIAGFMALRRPVSRHHAGFISAISVLVGIFSTIHNFPHLQHAS